MSCVDNEDVRSVMAQTSSNKDSSSIKNTLETTLEKLQL